MKKINLISTFLLALFITSNAYAVTIDFTAYGSGDTGSTSLVTTFATFNSFGGNIYIGAGAELGGNSICALQTGVFNCEQDFEAVFTNTVSNLTFQTGTYNPVDTVEVFAYDIGNNLLGSVVQNLGGVVTVDMTAFSGISRLLFDDSSTGAGFEYGNFTFDVASVPEASSIILLGLGLAGIGFSRRK